nr:hypothetical protein [Tanacetum cinerariifolium]
MEFDGTPCKLRVDQLVFWSQHHRNSVSDDDWEIHERIKCAFCNLNSFNNEKGLSIQFWAPVKTTIGRLLISTSNQPFSLVHLNTRIRKYRLCSQKYQYDMHGKEVDEKDLMILIGGLVSTAFLNHSPETIKGFKLATDEIENAIQIACLSHDLNLAQVWWIPNETSVSFSSDTQTKEIFLMKSNSYHTATKDPHLSSFVEFYDNCHVLPFKMEEGLVGKTLQTYQPHFCKNITKLKRVGSLFGLLSAINTNLKCSCLAISLRSTHTGDTVNYVFEFFWPQNWDCFILSGSLISTLKRCLPSFTFHSGSQLGADELCVNDVENSTASNVGFFRVPKGNKLSQTLTPCDKRKFSDFSSQKDNTSVQKPLTNIITKKTYLDDDVDNDDLVIVARYAENVTLFLLPTLSTLEEAKENISYDFDLDPHSFTLEDERDDGTCYRLDDDESFTTCIYVWRHTHKSYIRLRVHPRG